ncbi:hypothetical protein C8E97_4607 [Saccharothrix australiensis]|uniref:Uncharacterized protein n=1 Tax=Saccharothrix australiensis TaxID=2072 RepID=A0A495W352_9PSEU|nr:hypothetical protein C8E97_4607 [Saccharothrix australiensis]
MPDGVPRGQLDQVTQLLDPDLTPSDFGSWHALVREHPRAAGVEDVRAHPARLPRHAGTRSSDRVDPSAIAQVSSTRSLPHLRVGALATGSNPARR